MNTVPSADTFDYGIGKPANKIFSNSEYDNLTGYVVRTYTTTWRDTDGNLWRKTCEVVNLGRPDRGVPVDPDTQLAPAPWDSGGTKPHLARGPMARKRKADERFAEIQMQVSAYLRRNGPSHVKGMALDLEHKRTTLGDLMRKFEGVSFCKVGTCGPAVLWGVSGVHDVEDA